MNTRNNFSDSVGHMGDKMRYFLFIFHSILIYNSINIGYRVTI